MKEAIKNMEQAFDWLNFDNAGGKYFLKKSEDSRNNYALAIELNIGCDLVSTFMPPNEMAAFLNGIYNYVTYSRISIIG